jgi:dodecin
MGREPFTAVEETPSSRSECKSAVLVLHKPYLEVAMADSVYRVTEVIGVSTESWEAAARNAVQTAAGSVRDLRVAEVLRQDLTIENGQVTGYRVRLGISFKYESGD